MFEGIKIRFISQDDVVSIFAGNTKAIFNCVEDALLKYINGKALMPDKVSQIFDQQTQNRINCMPATLLDEKVCGVKWVSVFPTNAAKGLQNVSGIMLLSEIETGFPVAVIDGTFVTLARTAAVGCVAAKYLAPSKVETIGFIGGGEQAKMHFTLLKHLFPSIKECRISSRKETTEELFINTFSDIAPDVRFIACGNSSFLAASGADIIVTAISGQAPVLKAKDVTKGGLYIHVGGWEDDYGVALKANKIVVDDWEASKHRTQTICRMYKEGILEDKDIYCNLSELIAGKKVGRVNDDEFIYFNSVGLSFIDVCFANYIYKESLRHDLGREVNLLDGVFDNYRLFLK